MGSLVKEPKRFFRNDIIQREECYTIVDGSFSVGDYFLIEDEFDDRPELGGMITNIEDDGIYYISNAIKGDLSNDDIRQYHTFLSAETIYKTYHGRYIVDWSRKNGLASRKLGRSVSNLYIDHEKFNTDILCPGREFSIKTSLGTDFFRIKYCRYYQLTLERINEIVHNECWLRLSPNQIPDDIELMPAYDAKEWVFPLIERGLRGTGYKLKAGVSQYDILDMLELIDNNKEE